MRSLLVAIAILSVASLAQATVTATHDGGVPVAGLPGYHGFTVSLVSDTADLPAGFNGQVGNSEGFNGPMNQIWAMGTIPTPMMDTAQYVTMAQDSHFLLWNVDIVASVAPSENATNYLGGAFAILVAARSNPLPLAYLVIADTDQVQLTGTASDATAAEQFPLDLTIVIPEPLTLSLLSVGALALIRRRR